MYEEMCTECGCGMQDYNTDYDYDDYDQDYDTEYDYEYDEEEQSPDHEVGMAQNLLRDIVSNATQLMDKIGEDEINLPGWIQDHISQAQNYISQANVGYHEL
jgi:hypothetical protein